MTRNTFLRFSVVLAVVFQLASCDKDFNEIGTDIIGDDHFDFETALFPVEAESFQTGPVQSNNLAINPLGIYDDPNFGKTTASFVTQVQLDDEAPVIGVNPIIVDATLTIPYFSTLLSTDADGDNTYELDSIFNKMGKIDLKVYRSGYFLRDTDENLATEIHYTDKTEIDALKIGDPINDTIASNENTQFVFSAAEHTETTENEDDPDNPTITRTAPGMRLDLNEDFFQTAILNAASGNLANNNMFKNYFRGLYFKVDDAAGSTGALSMLNFSGGDITITYKADGTTAGERVTKTLVLSLTGNTISLLERENAPTTVPQDRLFVKGGDGYVTKLKLFNDAQIQMMIDEGWLINEASLTFVVDQDAMAGSTTFEPQRLYLYNLTNRTPILDYYYDATTLANPKFNKYIHNGLIERENVENGRGIRYKIRLTHYLRSLINDDSTNVELGLSVTESISQVAMSKLKEGNANNAVLNHFIPTASVSNPLGTVLYGPALPDTDPNKLQLVVYYTKPE